MNTFEVRRGIHENDPIVGKVTTRSQRVYAVTYAPYTDVDKAKVARDWAEDRRAFRPYDETTGRYLR